MRLKRRRRRDPEATLRQIFTLAEEAKHSEDARHVLHDVLLEAHDVEMPPIQREEHGDHGPLVWLQNLAEYYQWHINNAENEASYYAGRVYMIIFKPRSIKIGMPFTMKRATPGGVYDDLDQTEVYRTRTKSNEYAKRLKGERDVKQRRRS